MCGNHAALRVPLLILWGERDAWLPAGYGERLHGEVPGAELHLLDAGHMAHQERADRVNALLASFLTQ